MEIGYVLIAILFYFFGSHMGKHQGKKQQYEYRYVEGFRKGINQVESEIKELSKLPNKEILKRIKNFNSKKES
jgi:hypothetical protein